MKKTVCLAALLLILSLGLLACEALISMVLPNPWGISKEAPLGTFEKTSAYLQELGYQDSGDMHELNFISDGTVHFFTRANDNDRTSVILIVEDEKILAMRTAFVENPPTAGKGLMNDLWKKLSGRLPKLSVTRGASTDTPALWTGRFSASGVTGLWESEGLITTTTTLVLDPYSASLRVY